MKWVMKGWGGVGHVGVGCGGSCRVGVGHGGVLWGGWGGSYKGGVGHIEVGLVMKGWGRS